MTFDLQAAIPVLSRTPIVLEVLLGDLPFVWVSGTEGPATWSPYDVVGHLIHGERTDWMPRVEHLIAHGESVAFPVFDRLAQFEASKGKATWVAHDLDHLVQIARVMGRQYTDAVGPWRQYLRILGPD